MRRRAQAFVIGALTAGLLSCSDEQAPAQTPGAPAQPNAQPAPQQSQPRASARDSATLRAVRARNRVNCGVNHSLPGFAYPDNRGVWRGFEVDLCRAIAAAVIGDREAVQFAPYSATERFAALRAGEIDVLVRETSVTLSRDVDLGLEFTGVYYYDGQGIMAPRGLNIRSAAELSGARICVITGSTTESALADFFRSRGLSYEPVVVDRVEQARASYQRQACDALTDDISGLASSRSVLDNPQAHVILPDLISKEPMAAVVREGDPGWEDAVRWTLHAMILAEELGITSKNVVELRQTSTSPEVRRLLGVEPGFGRMMGIPEDWAFQVIRQVGNYGEVFEANLGQRSPLRLERGLNALWNAERPGLMYAPPVR
jgi:general L-amino acid transport system substrate-binding protein